MQAIKMKVKSDIGLRLGLGLRRTVEWPYKTLNRCPSNGWEIQYLCCLDEEPERAETQERRGPWRLGFLEKTRITYRPGLETVFQNPIKSGNRSLVGQPALLDRSTMHTATRASATSHSSFATGCNAETTISCNGQI